MGEYPAPNCRPAAAPGRRRGDRGQRGGRSCPCGGDRSQRL